jgi:hypothetical protein
MFHRPLLPAVDDQTAFREFLPGLDGLTDFSIQSSPLGDKKGQPDSSFYCLEANLR